MLIHELFKARIEKVENILITTHVEPDADGIGSQIALCTALRQIGKNVVCVNNRPLLKRYHYLDLNRVVLSVEEFKKRYPRFSIDLLIVADANSLDRVGDKIRKLVPKEEVVLFVDHHPCLPALKARHCIDSTMSATGELVGVLIDSLEIPFTLELALPLYTSILVDTNSFRYPSVTAETHRLVARLLDTGIQVSKAYQQIYGPKTPGHLKMLGKILCSFKINKTEEIAWLELKEKDLESFGVEFEDTLGLINNLLILDKIKVACMFSQLKNKVKVSLRSTGRTDVGLLSHRLGGGGHHHSAGAVIDSDQFEVTVQKTIEKLERMLKTS